VSRYAGMFAALAARGELAFGGFVMLGDPDLKTSAAMLDGLVEGGADMLEVGIPFSDPVADGPVIQAAAVRALRGGVTPADCFELLRAFRRRHEEVPVGVLTYASLVVSRGRDEFYRRAAAAGVDSVLVADVPLAESAPFLASAAAAGVDPVLIAAPNTPERTLAGIAAAGRGYTYCVARAGVTGADEEVRFDAGLVARLRALGAPSPVLGFGISRPEHVRLARQAGAAGIISGSAIVSLAAGNPGGEAKALARFAAGMKAATLA
jgi:tryptophan synthase alpha chain